MTYEPSRVCVLSEKPDVALELLSVGRMLADKLGSPLTSIAVGANADADAKDQIAHGADRVLVVEDPLAESRPLEWCLHAAWLMSQQENFEILLIGGTACGTEVAARLAQRLGVGCVSDCLSLDWEHGDLIVERRQLGRFLVRQVVEKKPAIATIPPRRFDVPVRDDRRDGELQGLSFDVPDSGFRMTRITDGNRSQVQIDKAETIICAGRGVKDKNDLSLVNQLARVLGGVVGGTRPLTDDLRWLGSEVKIGLSGATVKPTLYIACGISGQIEHIVGMQESGVVVAINNDPDAPIMQEADYRVVGDLYEIVPALSSTLQDLLE